MARKPEKAIDWEPIEAGYRAGILSVRELATAHKVSHTLINRKAKAEKWSRDLSAKIKAKADAIVSKAAVSTNVSKETEVATVEANATLQATVRLRQRSDIGRTLDLFRSLIGEIEFAGENQDTLEKAFEVLNDPLAEDGKEPSKAQADRLQKAREALQKVLSAPGRVDSAKRLTEMLEKLVRLEREAYGIDNNKEDDSREKVKVIVMPGGKDAELQ